MSWFFIFCIWANTPILAEERGGRAGSRNPSAARRPYSLNMSVSQIEEATSLPCTEAACGISESGFIPPTPHPSPDHHYCSELSLEPSDAWTFASSTCLGSIQDSCCNPSSFSNRGPWVLFMCIPQWSVLLCCWELLLCFIQPHAFMLTTDTASKKTPSKCGPKQLIMKGLAMVLQD